MKSGMKKGGMRKKAMKVSVIAKGKLAKAQVFNGNKSKTASGLKKSDLRRNKDGKIVSKRRSDVAKRQFQKNGLGKWFKAVKEARRALGHKGFVPVGGKTAKGQALYKKAKSLLKK